MEIANLKGIGPKTVKTMEKINVFTVEDLVTYYPFRFQIYNITSLTNVQGNQDVTVKGIIETEAKVFYIKRNLNRLTFRVNVEGILINVTIFNRAFLKRNLSVGKEILIYGKYDSKKNSFVAVDIKFDTLNSILIEPVYHLINGLTNKDLSRFIKNALEVNFNVIDYIPEYLNKKYNLLDKITAIKNIHIPKNINNLKKAKLKLIYEELYIFMFKVACLKKENVNIIGIERDISWDTIESFIEKLPFSLTKDQQSATKEIYKDMNSPHKMNRLLLGDVGSGKTIVSVISIYMNHSSGFQSAMMVPTEILATQHYYNIKKLLDSYNITTELLVGSLSKKEKENISQRLEKGQIDVIIGTHAIISENIRFKNLGLVITDEQHRFGVNQRSTLTNKGQMPDVLYMSATPIPRTFAQTLYGDMNVSIIKTKPQGRKDIKTFVRKESEIKEVLAKMLEEIKEGHQIYVVAPVIEENESHLHDVGKLKEKLDIAFNHKITTAIIHGKIKNNERLAIMNDFKNHKISILISTTVIEVGVDVENATMMVIFNAERFGLATLHQLRGRVGRNDLDSICYLICNNDTKRLEVLEETNDGFYISEKDFEMRGEGDLFGVKQSGDMSFKIADIKRDYKILLQAKEDVEDYMNNHNYKEDRLFGDFQTVKQSID